MKKIIVVMSLFLGIVEANVVPPVELSNSTSWTIAEKKLPLPSSASKEIQKTLAGLKQPIVESRRKFSSKTKEEWKEWVEYTRVYGVKKQAEKYNVNIKKEMIDGVNIYTITPLSLVNKNNKSIFLSIYMEVPIFLVEVCPHSVKL